LEFTSSQEFGSISTPSVSMIPHICATYADRTFMLLDITDILNVIIEKELKFHHSCVWDIQFLGKNQDGGNLPVDSIVTCSADNTIRVWHVDRIRRRRNKRNKMSVDCGHLLATIDYRLWDEEEDHYPSSVGVNQSLIASTATGLTMTNTKGVVEFDYIQGIPDFEIPDKPQSAYFPRALAIHPKQCQLATGDKSGKLKIFDLTSSNYTEIVQIIAHSAEILSLSYSPCYQLTNDENQQQDNVQWTVLKRGGGGGEDDEDLMELKAAPRESMILLASAGRDRLIHVFCSFQSSNFRDYVCVDTLDNHSASVLMVRFTFDGNKLISCGGDKTITIYNIHLSAFSPHLESINIVHNKHKKITIAKTIQTPMGTVNGLAVDVSNKFMVTSGQDKRLNIWNLHTGKHMRAYKNPEISSTELYKVDIDPSGLYIVTCGFDKSITMIDFYSGEVITQVFGHSELVTNISFSRDGSHIVTVGGDGCVIIWRIHDLLVKGMQDRLMELYANAQRRNQKLALKASGIVSIPSTIASDNAAVERLMPPPPPTLPGKDVQELASSVQLSLQSLKSKQNQGHLATGSGTGMNITGNSVAKRNRWKANTPGIGASAGATNSSMISASTMNSIDSTSTAFRTGENHDGERDTQYELHGRKVVLDKGKAAPNLNKFTLELTNQVLTEEKTWKPPTVTSSITGGHLHSGNRANAAAAEANDDVLQTNLEGQEDDTYEEGNDDEDEDDEEEDLEKLFLKSSKSSHSSPEDEAEKVFSSTQERLQSLQNTLSGLEDWLESKVRELYIHLLNLFILNTFFLG
jgi:WD40 repeat protein